MKRGFRPKQKGVVCSIEGCDNWCVGNDLCAKHAMQKYRQSEKYKAYTREYNKKYKRPEIDKVCATCQASFITARDTQYLCRECSGNSNGQYEAQKRHRAKHPERTRARDLVGKRVRRGVSMSKQPCVVCGSNAEAHHHDYSKPLDITWLCKQHHNLIPRQ